MLAGAAYPTVDHALVDADAETSVNHLIEAVTSLRRYRDELGVPSKIALRGRLVAEGYDEGLLEQLQRLGRVELGGPAGETAVGSLAIPGGAIELLETEGFDPAAADKKSEARAQELRGEIARLQKKLGNEQFVARAPDAVVQAERDKLAGYERELAALS